MTHVEKLLINQTKLLRSVNNMYLMTATSVVYDGAEGEVADAPLSADCGPRRLAWVVVLHHQRETAPGEVGTYVLLIHHCAHTVTHAGGTGWECEKNTLFSIAD